MRGRGNPKRKERIWADSLRTLPPLFGQGHQHERLQNVNLSPAPRLVARPGEAGLGQAGRGRVGSFPIQID